MQNPIYFLVYCFLYDLSQPQALTSWHKAHIFSFKFCIYVTLHCIKCFQFLIELVAYSKSVSFYFKNTELEYFTLIFGHAWVLLIINLALYLVINIERIATDRAAFWFCPRFHALYHFWNIFFIDFDLREVHVVADAELALIVIDVLGQFVIFYL